ncbi:MAG: HlyD family secretion protein, partial [Bacteroidota bacterium]
MSKNILDNIELRSAEVQEILTRVPHWMIRWGNFLFLSLILMMLLISWFVKYPDSIESEAFITTQIPPHKEYAKTSGLLQTILVENNQLVRANQPLAIIQNTANFEDVFLLQSIMDTIKLSNESIYFPIEKIPVIFLGEIEAEYAIFENNYMQYQLNKKLEPFSNEAIANANSISELNGRLNNLQSQRKISEAELLLKKKELE